MYEFILNEYSFFQNVLVIPEILEEELHRESYKITNKIKK
jgi:hypothetical protein